MTLGEFTLNGVKIKAPQGLSVSKVVERQRVILLNGKPKERIKRIYRVAVLSYSMIEDEELQKIIAETLTKSINEGITTVEICFLGLSGEMETMTAIFSDITASVVAESVMNGRWSEIEELTFEEV